MRDYSLKDLRIWNDKIEEIVYESGLNPYTQEFEICSYDDMLAYEAYLGMPSRYPHWSFGKAYERLKTYYRYNISGLPYEMVINSNPCLAYLMKDNTFLLQILTMAHVYGHNDFFRNNRLFRLGTRAEYTIEMFKSHARRVRDYISDPSIGYARVEHILDAAHALRLQGLRWIGEKRLSEEEKKERIMSRYYQASRNDHPLLANDKKDEMPDLTRIPLEPEQDLLFFLIEHAPLNEWERDLLQIIREESAYFLPQIESKIMNEGWASFWHYRILHELDLPQGMHLEFLKHHNLVIRPFTGGLNPYHLGFSIFMDLYKKHKEEPEFIFQVREQERDVSFLRLYLTRELCEELNLFQYQKSGRDYIVREVVDEEGWKQIRDTLIQNTGVNKIPSIYVVEVKKTDHTLILEHEWDGRELHLHYALETLKHMARLWRGKVRLYTQLHGSAQILETKPD
ncbi:MAG TPA: SpoVR family protein [Syntrophomonadaceae bacterium]|nr:SpoVR family protein [Syntrophomonadaceae bacterium]